MIKGNHVGVRALQKADKNWVFDIENNAEWWHLSQTILPVSENAIEALIAESIYDIYTTKQYRFVIENLASKKQIGLIDLFDYDPIAQKAGMGILIHDQTNRNQGFGVEAVGLVENHAFTNFRLNQIYVHIQANNKVAINFFKRLNYQKTGLLKQWSFWNGTYFDEVVMQKFKTK